MIILWEGILIPMSIDLITMERCGDETLHTQTLELESIQLIVYLASMLILRVCVKFPVDDLTIAGIY